MLAFVTENVCRSLLLLSQYHTFQETWVCSVPAEEASWSRCHRASSEGDTAGNRHLPGPGLCPSCGHSCDLPAFTSLSVLTKAT